MFIEPLSNDQKVNLAGGLFAVQITLNRVRSTVCDRYW
jgi:hypothetical protein